MKLKDFYYYLPSEQIARHPLPHRCDSRLLVVDKKNEDVVDSKFASFLSYVSPNDLLVFNDTKVMHARLKAHKATGGSVSILVERLLGPYQAWLHIKSNKKLKLPCELTLENQQILHIFDQVDGLFQAKLHGKQDFYATMESLGEVPLPPYIKREAETEDLDRYQTVYAKSLGAVAAPTAGLHFDEAMMEAVKAKNIPHAFVTLHVGAGTFQPVRVDNIEDHVMHHEYAELSEEVCEQIKACKTRGGRVFAIGTTVVRTLESSVQDGEIKPQRGMTNLFIKPPYEYKYVDAIFTNFHLPSSTLLMLVCAFGGYEKVMKAYDYAVKHNYRFFSYGDAMLLL